MLVCEFPPDCTRIIGQWEQEGEQWADFCCYYEYHYFTKLITYFFLTYVVFYNILSGRHKDGF